MAEEQKQKKVQEQMEKTVVETQTETKTEKVKEEKKAKSEEKKRTFVTARGNDLHISPKEGGHVCDMIRNRNVDIAIKWLEEVISQKRVLKMNNREVPHQHGIGVMAGRFPVNTPIEFIKILKHLRASAIYHEMPLEKCKITECYTNVASKPYKRGGARAKRAHVFLKLEMKTDNKKTENKQKENKK